MPHQERALDYALNRTAIALIMEMRLGKTLVAIRWMEAWRSTLNENPTSFPGLSLPVRFLVVAPLSVLSAWANELALERISETDITLIRGSKLKRTTLVQEPSTSTYHLVNYEALRATPEIANLPWSAIVLDESVVIRNPKALISKALIRNFSHVPLRGILTGLPAPESPLDYFCQYRFLENDKFMGCGNYWDFRKKFFLPADASGWDWQPLPGARDKIKRRVRKSSFVLTRKQAKLGNKKIYEIREVKMSSRQTRAYRELEENFEFKDRTGKQLATKWVIVQMNWLSQIAGGFSPSKSQLSQTKITELSNLLRTELKEESVVVWFRYNQELRAAKKVLQDLNPVWITGKTDARARDTRIKQFQSEERRILLCQSRCAYRGLDFSVASTSIYYSNYYDLEVRAQSEDRIEHPKKKEPLLYIDLVSTGTLDHDLVGVLQEKKVESRMVFRETLKSWRARRENDR
jgi:SNF2 family DNA or RNA helicase